MITPKPTIERNTTSDVDILVCLIKGVSLSDSQVTELVRAVLQSTISTPSPSTTPPPAQTSLPTCQPPIAHPVVPVEAAGTASPVSGPPVVARVMTLDANFGYHVPLVGEEGLFYIVTRGTDVGMFSGWENTSPLVDGISGCAYCTVATYKEGIECVKSALERNMASRLWKIIFTEDFMLQCQDSVGPHLKIYISYSY
ncbi:hypothetical protein EDD18DRAFT_1107787 [Armillaria luteobubalina]|uniref:Uncharacterized protein n=1 Tax=Armillaria luteobubalina TaxID=153913 RepID=A0AA39UL42_9AGAR|nr:hypothetical protein EDD18DRAFT_1107787 [Armillaria luteobubalina]